MQIDKILHFLAGYSIAITAAAAGFPQVGLGLSFIAGLGKEVYDRVTNIMASKKGLMAPHTVDPKDFFATVAGGIAAFVIYSFKGLLGL